MYHHLVLTFGLMMPGLKMNMQCHERSLSPPGAQTFINPYNICTQKLKLEGQSGHLLLQDGLPTVLWYLCGFVNP